MLGISRLSGVSAALLLTIGSACGRASDSSMREPEGPLSEPDDAEDMVPGSSDLPVSNDVPSEDLPVTPSPVCVDGIARGDVTATTQSDIDSLLGCEIIRGNLTIEFSDATLDLRPLATLEIIEGLLYVRPGLDDVGDYRPIQLRSLSGLEGLRSVSSLAIVRVESGIDPLSQLSGDAEQVILDEVAGLRDLRALGGVRITSMLSLNVMPDLTSPSSIGSVKARRSSGCTSTTMTRSRGCRSSSAARPK
jgi:hypothetical protein